MNWTASCHFTHAQPAWAARIATLLDVRGNKPLPETIKQDIIERTDGIPLFIEEMTKAVLEGGEPTLASIPSLSTAVPASLHASLMARLDRLGSAKEVVQIGAMIGREFSYSLLAAVAHMPKAELQWALDRVMGVGLLFRQGVPPHATYLLKHALVQDAAYGTLLRHQRRGLHVRIAEVLETQFSDIAENQPELLARHCTEAGLIEKAAALWGKAGLRSLEHSALVEAIEQLTRALDHIAALPSTPERRRAQIDFQVRLITPMMHVKGHSSQEARATLERARLLIEEAEKLGEPLDDPLLLYSVLHGSWMTNLATFNGDVICELAAQTLSLAEQQGATMPRIIAHRLMGTSLLLKGELVEARAHYDKGIALYNPALHRPFATRFGQDAEVAMSSYRAWALWLLGYPNAALAEAERALRCAREVGHAGTMMFALGHAPFVHLYCGNHVGTDAAIDELVGLAEEKYSPFWKAAGMMWQQQLLLEMNKASPIQKLVTLLAAYRAMGLTIYVQTNLVYLAIAQAELGKLDDAWRSIAEAISIIETTKERWREAEAHRVAGLIALIPPNPDAAKAETCFERALAVARQQQAKSWELRASMSLARLWRDQGKVQQARDLLAPVYGWFTEGFDTRDLKEAKALLKELAA